MAKPVKSSIAFKALLVLIVPRGIEIFLQVPNTSFYSEYLGRKRTIITI